MLNEAAFLRVDDITLPSAIQALHVRHRSGSHSRIFALQIHFPLLHCPYVQSHPSQRSGQSGGQVQYLSHRRPMVALTISFAHSQFSVVQSVHRQPRMLSVLSITFGYTSSLGSAMLPFLAGYKTARHSSSLLVRRDRFMQRTIFFFE
jgi:hypothetical protein